MKTRPLISIIIAVHNNETYLPSAVESVAENEFDEYEIIIVDDGSTDNTPQVADKLAEGNHRIKVIHQINQWIYASFNNGVKAACGDYVYILNSDDKLTKGAIDGLVHLINQYNNPDVIWTKVAYCKCDSDQNILEKVDWSPSIIEEQYIQNLQDEPEKWMLLIKSVLAGNQANLYKREILLENPFRNDIYVADYLFNLDAAKDIRSCVISKDETYLFHEYVNTNLEVNASIGKYYGYEHYMYNEIYTHEIKLLEDLGIRTKENEEYFKLQRRKHFSTEIKRILFWDNNRSLDEKLKCILEDDMDEILDECFGITYQEELEARILSELRNYYVKNPIDGTDRYYFMYELLESLLRYEKDDSDIIKIKKAVYNELNPKKIGEIFLKNYIL